MRELMKVFSDSLNLSKDWRIAGLLMGYVKETVWEVRKSSSGSIAKKVG